MDRLVAEALSYAATQGILMSKDGKLLVTHAPLTLLPSRVDRSCYELALRLSPLLNSMICRIADDHAYLRTTLAETAAADSEFTGRLLDIIDVGPPSRTGVQLEIFRHDFFVHQPTPDDTPVLRMVEMNCIAASFGCLSSKVSRMHRFFAEHPVTAHLGLDVKALPENDPMLALAAGIAQAHQAFCDMYQDLDVPAVRVIMVVQGGDTNLYDQDLLRFAIWAKHKVEVVRMTLAQIHANGSLTRNGSLRLAATPGVPEFIASVVYFRAGYGPRDYPSEKEWLARKLIESSTAASCPSVAVQLVGTKKIQQVLDKAGEVERFVDGPKEAALIRSCFARQYSLSPGPEGDAAARRGLEEPENYVLKPQREGGGNNLYSDKLHASLLRMPPKERSAHVLMERLHPVVVRNYLIRDGQSFECDMVCELGVFGIHVRADGNVLSNADGGTLLRSKLASENDGGVAAGVAVLDSPLLV